MGGRESDGLALLRDEPPGKGPVYLGPRTSHGRFDKRFDLIDSVLARSESAVEG